MSRGNVSDAAGELGMEKIAELLQQPEFWFATVFVSLLINLVSTYIVRAVDRFVERAGANRGTHLADQYFQEANRILSGQDAGRAFRNEMAERRIYGPLLLLVLLWIGAGGVSGADPPEIKFEALLLGIASLFGAGVRVWRWIQDARILAAMNRLLAQHRRLPEDQNKAPQPPNG